MSTPKPAHGRSDSTITLAPVDIAAAWNLRGDAGRGGFVAATERTLNLRLPVAPGTVTHAGTKSDLVPSRLLLSLGPGAWLFVSTGIVDASFENARRAINDSDGALFDVSASYVAWLASGTHVARVLNQGCPLDLDVRAFPVDHCAQSVLSHVSALFVRRSATAFIVFAARSFAEEFAHGLGAFAQSSTTTHVGA